ncbi:MAG: hypothetical protein LIO44_01465 [Eubacterium sp.]|nr:hypothetical protein [Eubacterium sp.]
MLIHINPHKEEAEAAQPSEEVFAETEETTVSDGPAEAIEEEAAEVETAEEPA